MRNVGLATLCALWLCFGFGASVANADKEMSPVEATRFVHGAPAHGVPGPWALSGYRIGADALKRLGLKREQAFAITVVHRAPAKVQYTCIADGLMAATGASPGKMNLTIENVANETGLETIITERKGKRQLVYRLTKQFIERIRNVPYDDFPKSATWLLVAKDEEIFSVEERAAGG